MLKEPSQPRPCKICGIVGHSATFCFDRPRKPLKQTKKSILKRGKPINRLGKHGKKWLAFRAQWFIDNPAPFYICYYCNDHLNRRETTLDHKIPRSRRPDLRYELDNIVPCCWRCNTLKGSKDDQQFMDDD